MITLDNIIRNYFAANGKNTLHGYLKYMKWAIDCIKDINQDYHVHDKVKILKMDKIKRAYHPKDMIDWVSLGVKIGDRIKYFSPDSSIAVTHERGDFKGYPRPNAQYNELSDNIINFFDAYRLFGRDYGWSIISPHNGIGYFTVECDFFQFSSEVKDQDIILTYKSSGFDANTETKIDERFENLIQEYIRWQESRFNPRFGDAAAETEMRRKSYLRERDDVLRRMQKVSFSDIRDIINRTTSFGRDTGY